MKQDRTMSTHRRRRDREQLNQVVGTLATVPSATGEVTKWIETLPIEPSHEDIARRAYQLHEERGSEHRRHLDDCFRAQLGERRRLPRSV
jgi:hypothetical protein